jgi:MFS family permease
MLTTTVERSAWAKLLFWTLAVFVCVATGLAGPVIKLPALAALIVFFLSLAVTFVRGTDGLILVIFAMLFSPEIGGSLMTGRATGEGGGGVVIRLEDVIMFAVVMGWILRSAYRGRHFGIVRTPVNGAIWAYMAASIVATLLGVLAGSVRSFAAGFFNNLKYFEYFLLFFMILAHVRSRDEIKRMFWALFLVFFFAMIYGYAQLGTGDRVCAPFDKEPNTFGGYMVLIMCLAGGIAIHDRRAKVRVPLILLMLFAAPPLLFTLSRASYMSLLVGLAAFLMISSHRVLIGSVVAALVCSMLLGMPLFPEKVRERVAGTFERETEYHVQVA